MNTTSPNSKVQLTQDMKELETLRQKAWQRFRVINSTVAVAGVLAIYLLVHPDNNWTYLIPLTGVLIASVIVLSVFYKKIKRQYKEKFVSPMMQQYFPELQYDPKTFIDRQTFNDSQLFSFYNRYTGDDFFSGEIDGQQIQFSELQVSQHTSNGKSSQDIPVFVGVFSVLKFDKPGSFEFYLLPDSMERAFGKLARKLKRKQTRKGEIYLTGDDEFDRLYQIRVNDTNKAKFVLGMDFVKYITEIHNRLQTKEFPKMAGHRKGNVFIAAHNQALYIGLWGIQLFKVPFGKSMEHHVKAFGKNIAAINTVLEIDQKLSALIH